jgi:hypothetical protein
MPKSERENENGFELVRERGADFSLPHGRHHAISNSITVNNPDQTMPNPKTDHHANKPTTAPHQGKRSASAAPEKQSHASASMIEACDRLGQQLEDLASLVRGQIEAGRQSAIHSSAEAQATERVPAAEPGGKMQIGARPSTQNSQQEYSGATPQTGPDQDVGTQARSEAAAANAGAPPSGARGENGLAAADASRLADTISRAQNTSQEQAAGMQQALEAIMAHLESQAAGATLKVDVADIMSRLRDLEEQQQSLQSQFGNNRWGP